MNDNIKKLVELLSHAFNTYVDLQSDALESQCALVTMKKVIRELEKEFNK